MKRFIFSCDGHIVEPGDIFSSGLPASMRHGAIVTNKEDNAWVTRSGDLIIHRVKIIENVDLGRGKLLGTRELAGRKQDMAMDGIDVPFDQIQNLSSEMVYAHIKKMFLKHKGADAIYLLGSALAWAAGVAATSRSR